MTTNETQTRTPRDIARDAMNIGSDLEYAIAGGHYLTACNRLGALRDVWADLAAECAIAAARAGNTQAEIAQALGVSARTLTGLKREALGDDN